MAIATCVVTDLISPDMSESIKCPLCLLYPPAGNIHEPEEVDEDRERANKDDLDIDEEQLQKCEQA